MVSEGLIFLAESKKRVFPNGKEASHRTARKRAIPIRSEMVLSFEKRKHQMIHSRMGQMEDFWQTLNVEDGRGLISYRSVTFIDFLKRVNTSKGN